jgi:4-hydroxybenzoate polyprenyltransferase
MTLTERLSHYEKLMRLDKPIGILLLLWPTLWAQWLASSGHPDWLILSIFAVGVVLMRSAGCVINDYADRDFDPHVARTRERPLAAGKVSPKEALLLAAGLSLLAFLLILPLNTLVLKLSVVALFLAASYPFTKRFFAIPQAYLGIAFGFGIPMSYAALWGEIPCSQPTFSGRLPTTRSTRWSTEKTTSRSASRLLRSPSAATISPPLRCATQRRWC